MYFTGDFSCCPRLAFSLLYLRKKLHHWEYSFFFVFIISEKSFFKNLVKLTKGSSLCLYVSLFIYNVHLTQGLLCEFVLIAQHFSLGRGGTG